MPGVLNLTNVFQLIVDGLDESVLAQEQFVPEVHYAMLHVPAHFGEQFETQAEEHIRQGLRDITAVSKELPLKACDEFHHRLAVVDLAWRQTKSQQCALIVDDERPFEAKKPSHRGLAPPGQACKDLVRRNAVMITDREGRRVDERHARAVAFARGEIATQGDEGTREQCDKALI